jgi:hypothetical protein
MGDNHRNRASQPPRPLDGNPVLFTILSKAYVAATESVSPGRSDQRLLYMRGRQHLTVTSRNCAAKERQPVKCDNKQLVELGLELIK